MSQSDFPKFLAFRAYDVIFMKACMYDNYRRGLMKLRLSWGDLSLRITFPNQAVFDDFLIAGNLGQQWWRGVTLQE